MNGNSGPQGPRSDNRRAQATDWFLRIRSENVRTQDLLEFQRWVERHPDNAHAYREVGASWLAVGAYASAPELVIARRDALENARQAAQGRWSRPLTGGTNRFPVRRFALAASILVAVGLFLTWSYLDRLPLYETGRGERRTLTLADGSVVTLDARSRMRVNYTPSSRSIALEAGQARFDVAKEPARPFRVVARGQTVTALGTQFNVDLLPDSVLVTLIEGRVAVSKERAADTTAGMWPVASEERIEMRPGEQLVAVVNKPAKVRSHVDVARTTAWQNGKLVFDDEPLASAAARMNRYSRTEIQVDASVGQVGISGIFNTGDTAAFTEAVTEYFPVRVAQSSGRTIQLTTR